MTSSLSLARLPAVDVTSRPSGRVLALAVVFIAALSGMAGWVAHGIHDTPVVQVSRVFPGTVSYLLNNQGVMTGCVNADHGGERVCASRMLASPDLRIGQHVRAARAQVSTGNGAGYAMLIVLPDN